MTKMRPWFGLLAALGLALSGTLTGTTVAGQALATTAAATHAEARAAGVPSCTAFALNVRKGRLEGAAGSRFQTVRVTNESARPCATPGWTRYRFARHGHAIGWRSPANPGERPGRPPVVIGAGRTVRSVLSWVDPGPVPPGQCHARTATAFRMRIRDIPGFYRLPLHARVCTTKKYRPHGTRLGDS
jgi:Domain of unknown function (DUF4232)